MKTRVNFCRCTQQSSLLSTGFTLKGQGSTGSCPSRAWLVAFTAFFNDRRETIFVILISEEGAVFLRKLGVTRICSEFVLCAIAVTLRNIMWQQFFFFCNRIMKKPSVLSSNWLYCECVMEVLPACCFSRGISDCRGVCTTASWLQGQALCSSRTPQCLLAAWMGHLAEETWALVHSLMAVGGREYTTAVSISSPRMRNRTFLEMLLHEVQGTAAVKI